MSKTTEIAFQGGDVPEDGTTTAVLPAPPEQGQEQHEHEHNHDGGELTPMCSGNGCVQKTSSN
ncbi:hypothetical protein [Saccharothrix variisporea]|uniref:Uncharacterized protein n=1 Tax=Saccharothrix variisporea TaxID=543527 RepID=A0A495X1L0_9PSEU|nr:hypothetical protein [Saccharothrix variisporea]RKT67439.1 hypothetical protein DFJ66_0614 [Saccharothrix variisporea]